MNPLQNLQQQKARIRSMYTNDTPISEEDIIKGELDHLNQIDQEAFEKAKKGAPIGTKKMFGGREYIKTATGWKYSGKGGGKKAQEHAAGAKGHSQPAGGNKGAAQQPPHVGKTITAPDGTKGKIAHQDNDSAYVSTDDGKTHKVPNDHLENKYKKELDAAPDPNAAVAKTQSDDPKADVNKRFEAFARFTKSVMNGGMKSMIAYGTGGVGKTYTVTSQLEAAGKKAFDEDKHVPGDDDYDYVKITGKSTPTAVYKALFEHNGKIILFDDCDSVLQHEDAINLFKGALDTSGDGTISYGSAKAIKDDDGEPIPKRFKFDGKVMFISNLPSDKVPQPLKSRALRVDLTMSPEQTIDRIRYIATHPETKEMTNLRFPGIKKYTTQDMKDVIQFIDDHKDILSDINVRTVGAMLAIKQQADKEGVDWKEDAQHMVLSKAQQTKPLDVYNGGIVQARAQIVKSLYKSSSEAPSDKFDRLKKIMKAESEEYVSMPKKDFVDEHEDLIDTLNSPSRKDDKKEAKDQQEELDKELKKGHADPIGTQKTFGGHQYVKTAEGWKHVSGPSKPAQKKQQAPKKVTDHTSYIVHNKGKFHVDREDVNTGHQVTKPGDKIKFKHKGEWHEGEVSHNASGRDNDTHEVINVKKTKDSTSQND